MRTIATIITQLHQKTHGEIFSTSNHQFTFKKEHSTKSTFALQHVIDYYTQMDSSCYVMLLDASKTFHRVEYVQLFRLLCNRGLCPKESKMLIYIYTNQNMKVRWNDVSSELFTVSIGMKQWGVLSPTQYCVYFDEFQADQKAVEQAATLGINFQEH